MSRRNSNQAQAVPSDSPCSSLQPGGGRRKIFESRGFAGIQEDDIINGYKE